MRNQCTVISGDIIETVRSLQSLDVSHIKDKDKQKSEAKHIHLRKRRALADLFKSLQNIGKYCKSCLMILHLKDDG